MTEVKVVNVSANRIMEIVREMKYEKIDFTFSYTPSKWDTSIGHTPNFTIFKFSKDKEATYFILKWKLK